AGGSGDGGGGGWGGSVWGMLGGAGVPLEMKRSPRRGAVAINWGRWALSPRAWRSSRMHMRGSASLTYTSDHTACSNSAWVTSCPGRSSKQRNTANVLGRRAISCVSRHKRSCTRSHRKGGKKSARAVSIKSPPPPPWQDYTPFIQNYTGLL